MMPTPWRQMFWNMITQDRFMQDLIYESPDGGRTVRIRRSRQWGRTKYSEHQLIDLLDLLHASETDSELRELLDQAFVYYYLIHT